MNAGNRRHGPHRMPCEKNCDTNGLMRTGLLQNSIMTFQILATVPTWLKIYTTPQPGPITVGTHTVGGQADELKHMHDMQTQQCNHTCGCTSHWTVLWSLMEHVSLSSISVTGHCESTKTVLGAYWILPPRSGPSGSNSGL